MPIRALLPLVLNGAGCAAACSGSNSRNFTLSPSGELMLVASQDADAVEVLRIDASSGALERVDTVPVNCAADAAVL